jgi:cytochrome c oxidase subunit II
MTRWAANRGPPHGFLRLHDTVCTTACRTSHDLPVQPGVIPLGRQPVSPTPGAPSERGAHDPGRAPGADTARRVRRWALRSVLLGAVVLGTAGCQSTTFTRLGLPVPVTRQGEVVVTLWRGSWIAAFCVGAVVWGMILWAVIFHRKNSDRPPRQVRYNLPIEIMYTVVPFIMIAVLFYFTARDENFVNAESSRPAVSIDVTGFQWSWEFAYPQFKVPGSAAGHVTVTGRPYPGPLPVLVMPENETVKFTLNSLDVVHSFWVPVFVFKRDVIPNHTNSFQVTATKTGTFIGRCTELCGVYHSLMLFKVEVVTPQQFRTIMAAKQAQQQAGGVQ